MPEARIMDCQQANEILSAYYDQELSPEVKTEVAQHLAGCDQCATDLAAFGELSAMAQSLSHPVPPEPIWDSLQSQLRTRPSDDDRVQQSRGWLVWMRRPAARFALAAAATVLIAIGWFSDTMSNRHDEHQLAAIFGQYFEQFQNDPHAAQEILLANCQSRAVTADQAIHAVGYRPMVAEGLPPGYSPVSTHVMRMPCCTCVHCLCQRDDGTAIAIFEHDNEPNWYGDRTSRNEVCNGTCCSLIQLNGRLAATWQHGERHISVVGARDAEEVCQLVAWFDKRRRSLPN